MAAKARHVDYYPDEYVAGTGGQLSAAEGGVYWMICSLIYSRGEPIDDDHMWLSRLFAGTHWRSIRTIIDRLVETRKVQRIEGPNGPQLMVKRCASELQKALSRSSQAAENGVKGGRPPNDFKELDKPDGSGGGKLTTNHQPPTKESTDVDREELEEAFDAYNAEAKKSGWPEVSRRTPQRRAALKARLQECGGLGGWKAAMERAGRSPFLTGQTGREGEHANWRPDIDFFVQAKHFTKLIEGSYDQPKTKAMNGTNGHGQLKPDWDARARYFAKHGWRDEWGDFADVPQEHRSKFGLA